MASNPILERQGARPGRVSVDELDSLAAELNAEHWVHHIGRHYFVSREVKGEKVIHSLAWQPRRA